MLALHTCALGLDDTLAYLAEAMCHVRCHSLGLCPAIDGFDAGNVLWLSERAPLVLEIPEVHVPQHTAQVGPVLLNGIQIRAARRYLPQLDALVRVHPLGFLGLQEPFVVTQEVPWSASVPWV